MSDLPFGPRLKQPDQRSCGPSCLVVARMLLDPAYADEVQPRFDTEVLETHRRVTGSVSATGASQIPWPRALGTPPWAAAREMTAVTGTTYEWRWVRLWGRDGAFGRVTATVRSGLPVPVYVGNALLPRHVVLALREDGDDLEVYNPSSGRLAEVSEQAFEGSELGLSGWDVPWFTVEPRP